MIKKTCILNLYINIVLNFMYKNIHGYFAEQLHDAMKGLGILMMMI
jgi:hypothetical protein